MHHDNALLGYIGTMFEILVRNEWLAMMAQQLVMAGYAFEPSLSQINNLKFVLYCHVALIG